MKKNLLLVVFAVAVLAVGAYLYINTPAGYQATEQDGLTDDSAQAPASDNGSGQASLSNSNAALKPAMINIAIQSNQYSSQSLTVKKGTIVTWTNLDAVQHTVTSDIGSVEEHVLKSASLFQNGSYTYTFDKAGTYDYHCKFHSKMKATIIVTE